MKISYLELDKLVPYEKNAKKHPPEQIEKLAREIATVGWTQPIVVDHEMNIVVGHGRRLAALHLGLSKVPVYVLHGGISPARLKAMRLFDNKIQETGFDIDLLNQELFELSEIPDFDIKLTGFELPGFFEEKLLKKAEGAKELLQEDFEKFDHECPKCGFQWGQHES